MSKRKSINRNQSAAVSDDSLALVRHTNHLSWRPVCIIRSLRSLRGCRSPRKKLSFPVGQITYSKSSQWWLSQYVIYGSWFTPSQPSCSVGVGWDRQFTGFSCVYSHQVWPILVIYNSRQLIWWVQVKTSDDANPYSLLNWTPIENQMDHPTIWSGENQWSWSRVLGRYRNLSKFDSQISSSKILPISFWNPGKSGRTRRLRKK